MISYNNKTVPLEIIQEITQFQSKIDLMRFVTFHLNISKQFFLLLGFVINLTKMSSEFMPKLTKKDI